MSIKYIDDFTMDIYIKKEVINSIDFKSQKDLEKYLKKLFKILNDKYDIKIEGFYEITVYIDKYYGVVLNIKREDLEYYSYFKNQVDMRISTVDTNFLYLIDDMPHISLNKFKVIIKNKNIYLKICKKLTESEMMELVENSKIVYNI